MAREASDAFTFRADHCNVMDDWMVCAQSDPAWDGVLCSGGSRLLHPQKSKWDLDYWKVSSDNFHAEGSTIGVNFTHSSSWHKRRLTECSGAS
jgi:hypothetical protein